MRNDITAERLRELLHYDRASGDFTRLTSVAGRTAGTKSGAHHKAGYLQIQVDGRNYLAHRLVWLYVTGAWPQFHIDHIDGNRKNNSLSNLREVDLKANAQNLKRAHIDNKTGFLGVTARRGKFSANILVDGRTKRLGVFATAEAAHAAYLQAKRAMHEGCTI